MGFWRRLVVYYSGVLLSDGLEMCLLFVDLELELDLVS